MKSPYRKGVQITVSNAAVQAAASLVSNYYRGANPQAVKALMNLAAEIVDEIEARSAEVTDPEVIKAWAQEKSAA